MKYMLMMNSPGAGPYKIEKWSKQDIEAHMNFMRELNRKMRSAGELVGAEGLSGPDQAKLVVDRSGDLGVARHIVVDRDAVVRGHVISIA